MSPFGAVSRKRGLRNPLAYNSISKPGGTLGRASGGLFTTWGRLMAKAFEVGEGKSWTMILRLTPGASPVQSLIAALPVRSAPFSAAAAFTKTITETAAKKIAWKIGWLGRRAFIAVESFGRRVSRGFESSAANVCLTRAL